MYKEKRWNAIITKRYATEGNEINVVDYYNGNWNRELLIIPFKEYSLFIEYLVLSILNGNYSEHLCYNIAIFSFVLIIVLLWLKRKSYRHKLVKIGRFSLSCSVPSNYVRTYVLVRSHSTYFGLKISTTFRTTMFAFNMVKKIQYVSVHCTVPRYHYQYTLEVTLTPYVSRYMVSYCIKKRQ